MHRNLGTGLRELEGARSKLVAARDDEAEAGRAVAATQKRIGDLTARSDGVVVEAFMNPPADDALDAMAAPSTGDASLKASIVGLQHDADASVLASLHAAHQDLDARKAAQHEAARRAAAAADEAAAGGPGAAQSQEAAFVLEVQARLDQTLAEAEALAAVDPALAAQLKAQESEIAGRLEAIRTVEEQRKALAALREAQAESAAQGSPSSRRRRRPPGRARWGPPPAASRTSPAPEAGRSRSTARWRRTCRRCCGRRRRRA